jgi:hypothetical protein
MYVESHPTSILARYVFLLHVIFSCLDSKYILRIKRHYEGTPEELKGKESTPMQCTRGGQMTSFSIEEEWGLL